MPYLRCGRCGLQFRIQAAYLQIENCPRCLARSATAAPLTLSAHRVSPAVGWGAPPRDDRDGSTHARQHSTSGAAEHHRESPAAGKNPRDPA
jgi:hypothetical protein